MWQAIYRLKRQPTEIEADLSHYHGLDIRDWHRGTLNEWGGLVLSSRMLLVRVQKLPADSETKRDERCAAIELALHNGSASEHFSNWTYFEDMVKTLTNETAQMRVDIRALGNRPSPEPPIWHSPSDIRAIHEAAEDAADFRDDVLHDLASGLL